MTPTGRPRPGPLPAVLLVGVVVAGLLLGHRAGAQATSDASADSAAPSASSAIPDQASTAGVAPAAPSAKAAPSPTAETSERKHRAESVRAQKRADDAAAESAAEAAVAQLKAETSSSAEASSDASRINVYGFADFGFMAPLNHAGTFAAGHSTFAIGHLNMYFGADLGKGWRTLAEVRFLYLPHGNDPRLILSAGGAPTGNTFDQSNSARTDDTVYDPTQPSVQTPLKWGGIDIQRAYVEYTQSEYLTVRAGQFLTPYGIWNVDHGSPTVIGVHMPFAVAAGLFPDRQTGLEIYGNLYLQDTQVGYHLTLSNGRGPVDSYMDLDNNKAVGGRMFLKNDRLLGSFSLGASAYRGTYTNSDRQFRVNAGSYINIDQPVLLRYEELSLAGDLKWELGGLLVQGEILMNEVAYKKGRPSVVTTQGIGNLQPDFRSWGTYGLVGYRTPWFGVMPYVAIDYYNGVPFGFTAPWCGLNVRPTGRVVLKAQYSRWIMHQAMGFKMHPADLFEAQIAWGF
jgi:hypothetical protein